jgi:O-antigen/teichoic acid export membrane protein
VVQLPAAVGELDVGSLGTTAVVQLVLRAVATRGITLVGTVALARLLSPSEFGVFAIVSVFVTFLSLVGDFGIGASLVQQDHEPTNLELSTAIVSQIATWGTIVVVIWLAAGALPTIRPDLPPDSPALVRVLAPSLLFVALRLVPTLMLTRVLRFGALAAIEVGQQAVYFGIAVVLAAQGHGVWSFAIATLVQSAFATIAINLVWRRWVGLRFDWRVARRLLGFGLGYQLAHIVGWARDAVVPLFGGLAGGLNAVGYLGFAWRNGQLVTAVEQIVQRVTFPAFSRLQRDPDRQARMTLLANELVILPVAGIQGWIIATAPTLVPVLFSNKWTPAVVPLQLVCIGSLAGASTFVLRSLIYARGDSRRATVLALMTMVVLLVSFPLLTSSFGLAGAGVSFVLSAYVGLALHLWATRSIAPFPWAATVRILSGVAAAAVAAAITVSIAQGVEGLLLSGVVYSAILAVLGWRFERRHLLDLRASAGRQRVDAGSSRA